MLIELVIFQAGPDPLCICSCCVDDNCYMFGYLFQQPFSHTDTALWLASQCLLYLYLFL